MFGELCFVVASWLSLGNERAVVIFASGIEFIRS